MNEVFPTEYCPISSTIGFESNHASESAGWPPISWNLPCLVAAQLAEYSVLAATQDREFADVAKRRAAAEALHRADIAGGGGGTRRPPGRGAHEAAAHATRRQS